MDRAAEINALLADPTRSVVELEAQVYPVSSSVIIPVGKSLVGKGREATRIVANPDFVMAVAGTIAQNSVIVTAQNNHGLRLQDLCVDANMVGIGGGDATRICAVIIDRCLRFSAARLNICNATAYGILARGDTDSFTLMSSGEIRDVWSTNCQVHFEQMFCDGVLLDNVHGRGGDSTKPGYIACSAGFHPVTGSRNIRVRSSSFIGKASTGVEITANVRAMEKISFDDTEIIVEAPGGGGTGGQAFVITAGYLGVKQIRLRGSRFISKSYIGGNIKDCDLRMTDTYFEGRGGALNTNNAVVHASDCEAVGWGLAGETPYGVSGAAEVNWDGGAITAYPTGNTHSANVNVSPATRLSPFGGGFYFASVLSGPNGNGATPPKIVAADAPRPWTFPVKKGRRYFVSMSGRCQASVLASEICIGVRSTLLPPAVGPCAYASGTMSIGAVTAAISGAGGIGAAGSYLAVLATAVDTDQPFSGNFTIIPDADGTASIEFAPGGAGQALIQAGSSISVTER